MHREFIYPEFSISKTTFNTILGTSVENELAKLEAWRGQFLELNYAS